MENNLPQPRTFGQKLQAVIDQRGLKRRGLARAIAARTGQDPEHVRRALYKWIDDGKTPVEGNRHAVEDTLGLERDSLKDDEDEDSPLSRERIDGALQILEDLHGELKRLRRRVAA